MEDYNTTMPHHNTHLSIPLKRIDLLEVEAALRAFEDSPGALDNGYGGGVAEDPGTFRERMKRLDLGVFGGKAQGLGADAKMSGGFSQIEPALDAILGSTVHRDLVMQTQ
jgi:hypothetical protein